MRSKKPIALVAAGLVAGLVLGSLGVSYAATSTGSSAPGLGMGARMGSAIRDAGGRLADIVADLTGLTVDEVKAERAEGRSMEEIAESNGVDGQAVIDAAVEARTTILDAKVAEGTITREQADAAFERMTDRIGERVTSVEVGRPEWAGQGRGRGQMGSGTCDGSCTAAQ